VPRPALPVLAGLVLGVLFVTANVWALHDPQPHAVPIAIYAGAPAEIEARIAAVPFSDFELHRVPSPRDAVRRHEAYYGYGFRASYYAGANGQTVNKGLPLSRESEDVAPLAEGDPNGTSLSQIVLGTILGGFLTGVLMAQLALGVPLWQRTVAYLGFAVVFGSLVAVVVSAIDVLPPGSWLAAWIWSTATALTIVVVVGALARVAGQAGIPLAMLLLLILGNPSAGASVPVEYLPWLFRTVGPYLPPNALGTGLIGTTYFDADVLRPILVLAVWALAASLALGFLDRSHGSRRALAYDAAAAADETEDR
jgi:hypothetical protein